MHMADALLSPAVGGTMWAVSAGSIAFCSAKVRSAPDDRTVPLMGVLGAFLFAAQMINFSIPATGSSGHLGGGLLLAILLGPCAAFLTISSVLVVQALFFADGGLLALGCNIFNMGFIPAFIVYPYIYRKLIGNNPDKPRRAIATMISAVICMQLGPFSVVLETWFSGIASLPFSTFVLLMQPIHLAIGVVEGIVTIAVVSFVRKARPEILHGALEARPAGGRPVLNVVKFFLIAALLLGGIVSRFASKNPDGLEWAIARVTGKGDLEGPKQGLHRSLAALQEKTVLLPDYSFKTPAGDLKQSDANSEYKKKNDAGNKLGTTVSGLTGSLLTLIVIFLSGFILSKRKQTI